MLQVHPASESRTFSQYIFESAWNASLALCIEVTVDTHSAIQPSCPRYKLWAFFSLPISFACIALLGKALTWGGHLEEGKRCTAWLYLSFLPLQQWLLEVCALSGKKKRRMENLSGGVFSVLSFVFLPALFLVISDWGLMSSSVLLWFFFLLFIKRACVYVCVRVLCLISLTIFVFSIILVFPRLLPPGNAQCDKVVLPQIR